MKLQKTLLSVLVASAALAAFQPATAAPVFQIGNGLIALPPLPGQLTGLNDLELINRENIYRTQTACDAIPGSCLPHDAFNDPVGYSKPNPAVPGNIQTGDLFAGVLNLRVISNLQNGTTWVTDPIAPGIDEFTGYFLQEVQSAALIGPNTTRILLRTPTVADPFNILNTAAGESAGLWVDDKPGATVAQLDGLVSTFQSIASTTNGDLWAKLGIGLGNAPGTAAAPGFDANGYAYSEVNIGGGLQTFSGNFFSAYNVLSTGIAYKLPALQGINDPGELTVGGLLGSDPAFFPPPSSSINNFIGTCTPTASYACNDVTGNGQLTPNQNISPWTFASEDPFQLNTQRVPEPASLSLLSLALLGLGAFQRRRKG